MTTIATLEPVIPNMPILQTDDGGASPMSQPFWDLYEEISNRNTVRGMEIFQIKLIRNPAMRGGTFVNSYGTTQSLTNTALTFKARFTAI